MLFRSSSSPRPESTHPPIAAPRRPPHPPPHPQLAALRPRGPAHRRRSVTDYGDELAPNHPGYHDKEYRARRKYLGTIAFGYRHGQPLPAPAVLLSGGETTVVDHPITWSPENSAFSSFSA